MNTHDVTDRQKDFRAGTGREERFFEFASQ
jgi:hypothetical protein